MKKKKKWIEATISVKYERMQAHRFIQRPIIFTLEVSEVT